MRRAVAIWSTLATVTLGLGVAVAATAPSAAALEPDLTDPQVIRDLYEGLVDNARVVGAVLSGGLEKVAANTSGIGDVRGLGLMLGSEFVTADGQPDPGTAQRAQACCC